MLTIKELDQVKAIAKDTPAVAAMLKEWTIFSESPYIDSYMTIFNHITNWNDQLKIGQGNKGKINILLDKDSEKFDRVNKYFKQIGEFNSTLDMLRSKMTPEQKEVLSKKMEKNPGVAL